MSKSREIERKKEREKKRKREREKEDYINVLDIYAARSLNIVYEKKCIFNVFSSWSSITSVRISTSSALFGRLRTTREIESINRRSSDHVVAQRNGWVSFLHCFSLNVSFIKLLMKHYIYNYRSYWMKYLPESISNWKFNEATWASLNHFQFFPHFKHSKFRFVGDYYYNFRFISTNLSRNFPLIFNLNFLTFVTFTEFFDRINLGIEFLFCISNRQQMNSFLFGDLKY